MVIHSTGGEASNLNKDKQSHRTLNNMMQCLLYTAALPDCLWCFALQHATFIHQRICTKGCTETPYFLWHDKHPDFWKLHVFGSTIYVHNDSSKSLGEPSFPAAWLGYGPSTSLLLYWDPDRNIYLRCHHGHIDDYAFLMKNAAGQIVIDIFLLKSELTLPLVTSILDIADSPFLPHNSQSYTVTIPPSVPIGFCWKMILTLVYLW